MRLFNCWGYMLKMAVWRAVLVLVAGCLLLVAGWKAWGCFTFVAVNGQSLSMRKIPPQPPWQGGRNPLLVHCF